MLPKWYTFDSSLKLLYRTTNAAPKLLYFLFRGNCEAHIRIVDLLFSSSLRTMKNAYCKKACCPSMLLGIDLLSNIFLIVNICVKTPTSIYWSSHIRIFHNFWYQCADNNTQISPLYT
jgi:hypothetical protein